MNWSPPACAGRARRSTTTRRFCCAPGRTLATLLAEDYDRLQAILRAVM